MTRYIGLDAHSESCTIAVLGGSGKRLRHERLQTSAELLKSFIKEVPRPRHLCMEEGTLPDYKLFAALPGAGPALAPRLLVAFGERRERFPNAAALQKYAGVAPVTERSARSPSSGSASFTAAGLTASPTTNHAT